MHHTWNQHLTETAVVDILESLNWHKPRIEPATTHADRCEATDLIIITVASERRINVRLRDHYYFTRYPNDITFRSRNRYSYTTEVDKVFGHEQFGDFMFYGFANPDRTGLAAWRLIDLETLRWYHNNIEGGVLGMEIPNSDDTAFRAVDLTDIADHVVVHQAGFVTQPQMMLW